MDESKALEMLGNFQIPDCGHTIDCADRETDESGFRVAGPSGEWKCYHIEHGPGGMLIPVFVGMRP